MPARSRLAAVVLLGLLAGLFAACATPAPAPTGSPIAGTEEPPRSELILGCVSVAAGECRFVAERLLALVPPDRGAVISLQIALYGCAAGPGCPPSLDFRGGEAVVDFADGGEPLLYSLTGPPAEPGIRAEEIFVSGPLLPESRPVGGAGPFPFQVGHCGIGNSVDFDASWWVPVGEVDGDAPAMINSEQGQIRLLGIALAEYVGPDGSRVTLARFPGAKRLRLCR